MELRIILTNGNVIELKQIEYFEQIEELKDKIEEVLNNNSKFIHFNGSTFNNDIHLNKQSIESIVISEVNR